MSSSNRVSRLSSQPIYVPIRVENPITGEADLSAVTPEVAIVQGDPTAVDYRVATLGSGTWQAPDGEDYYIVALDFPANEYAKGTYHVWVKFTEGTTEYVMRSGRLEVY